MFDTVKAQLIAYIEKVLTLIVPVGSVIYVLASEVPEGFLLINGQKVYQSVNPRLYGVLSPLPQLAKGTDSTGAYVQLPNADGRVLQATTNLSLVGQLLEAGLPNITGILGGAITDGNHGSDNGKTNAQGAFELNSEYDSAAKVGSNGWSSKGVSFDASSSSAIFGRSNTVQLPALRILPCIKF